MFFGHSDFVIPSCFVIRHSSFLQCLSWLTKTRVSSFRELPAAPAHFIPGNASSTEQTSSQASRRERAANLSSLLDGAVPRPRREQTRYTQTESKMTKLQ